MQKAGPSKLHYDLESQTQNWTLGFQGSEGFTHFLYSDHWAMLCQGLTLQAIPIS